MLLLGQSHGLVPVRGLADDLDVGLGRQDHAEAGPDQCLIVDDEYPDRHGAVVASGSRAATTNPPSGRGPASSSPPSIVTRSRIPTRP